MFDFKKEIFHHIAGEFGASVAQQSQDDEVAVPAVHLVEAAARDDIFIRQIQQAVGSDGGSIDLTELMDDFRQALNVYVYLAIVLQLLDGARDGESRGKIENRSDFQFR